eukprot:gene1040-1129_t
MDSAPAFGAGGCEFESRIHRSFLPRTARTHSDSIQCKSTVVQGGELAQWIARQPSELEVASSSLAFIVTLVFHFCLY